MQSKIKIEVTDLAGKLVLMQDATIINGDNRVPVDVSGLPSGSYFVKIFNSNKSQTAVGKFVKE